MSNTVKFFYKGQGTDLIMYVKSEEAVQEYLESPSIGKLPDTVEVFQIYTNNGRGVEGQLGEASHAQLENEFGRGKKKEEVMDLILKNGKVKATSKFI